MERPRARTGGAQPHNPPAIGIHRTGTEEALTAGRARLAHPRSSGSLWRNLGLAGLAWFLVIAFALTGYFVVVVPLGRDILDNDLTLVYIGARIALEHGWSHVYSLTLQHQLFAQLRPAAAFNDGERFLSPPPFAWLMLPLTAFGPAVATYVWLAVSLVSLVAAWWLAAPPGGRERTIWLLAALAWYPVLYSLSLAQPDLVIVFAVAACWRLTVSGRQYLAGAVLALSLLKPQLTLLLPLVLLASGRWRVAAGWAVVAAILATASLAMIGPAGLSDYRSLLAEAQHVTNNRYFTLAYFVGPGAWSYVAQVVVAVVAAAAAYLNRHASHERIFALGVVATALGATYWHLQDYAVLVPAAWLFWRAGAPAFQRWWLLVIAIAGELAWPLRPWPILLALAVWLAFLAVPVRPAEREATLVPATP